MQSDQLFDPAEYELVCVDCGFRKPADTDWVDLDETVICEHAQPGIPEEHPDYRHTTGLRFHSESSREFARQELERYKPQRSALDAKRRRVENGYDNVERLLNDAKGSCSIAEINSQIEQTIESLLRYKDLFYEKFSDERSQINTLSAPFADYLSKTESTASKIKNVEAKVRDFTAANKLRYPPFFDNDFVPRPSERDLSQTYECIKCGNRVGLIIAKLTDDWTRPFPRILVAQHESPKEVGICPNSYSVLSRKDLSWMSDNTRTRASTPLPRSHDENRTGEPG